MADKTVSVTLRAKVEQYLAAMRQASTATGKLATDAQSQMNRLGTGMQSVGRTMTLGITTPLIAAGGASVHMASQFEGAFGRMVGLAGVSASEVDALQASVLGLAGQTAQSPQQLAEALYFLRSSGLDADEAMQALEQSAMASAAGMGDTAVIADAVSSAMNAYAASGLSAAEATDILVATARAGKAEPTELAGALGRILPIASELGVSFEDVGGAVAALSLNGNDASTSATLLSNVLSKLLKPSQQGAEALAAVGLSTDMIRESIGQNGLLATLEMLQSRLGDTGFVRFMEDAQAVQGALTLVGDESGNVAAAFDTVAGSAGSTGQAFGAMAGTDAMTMKQALVDIQIAMIDLGNVLLPIAAKIASGVAGAARVFADLPAPLQYVAAALGAVAAAGGPVLVLAGSLVKNWKTLSETFSGSAGKIGKAGVALGALGLAITAGYIAYRHFTREERELNERTAEVAGSLGEQTTAVLDLAAASRDATGAVDGLALANAGLGQALANTGEDGEKIREAFGALRLPISEVVFWMDALQDNDAVRGSAFEEMARRAGVAEEYLSVLADTIMETDENGEHLRNLLAENLRNAFGLSTDASVALADSLMPVASHLEELDDQSEKFDGNAITRDFLIMAGGSSDLANNLIILAEAQTGLTRRGEHTRSIMAKLLEIIEALPPEAEAAARAALGLGDGVTELEVAADAAVEATTELLKTAGHTQTAMKGLGDVFVVIGKDAGHLADGLKDAGDALTTLDVKDTAGQMDVFADAVGAAERELPDLGDALDAVADRTLDAAEAADVFADAFDRALGSHGAGMRVVDQVNQGWLEFAENVDDSSDALDTNTEAGLTNRGVVMDAADDIKDLIRARIEEGWAVEDINAEYQRNREHLLDVAEAAGLNRDQVETLIDEYGLVPELVETTVAIAGQAFAEWQIDRFRARLDALPEHQQVQVEALLNQGMVAEAEALLDHLTRNRSVYIGVHGPGRESAAGRDQGGSRAFGGYRDTPETTEWGHGPEVMLPLRNEARMTSLLTDPRVGPFVAAAMPDEHRPVTPVVTGGDTYIYVTNHGRREITRYDLVSAFREARAAS